MTLGTSQQLGGVGVGGGTSVLPSQPSQFRRWLEKLHARQEFVSLADFSHSGRGDGEADRRPCERGQVDRCCQTCWS